MCPWFEARIRPDGVVIVHRFGLRREREAIVRSTQFLASSAELARFGALLSPLRPQGERRTQPVCRVPWQGPQDDPLYMPEARQLELNWSGRAAPAHLSACISDRAIYLTVKRALAAIRILPGSGERMSAKWRDLYLEELDERQAP
ncbi:MAG: hypothetical protein ACJ8ER_05870 [Allosphingosinicella sp.]